MNVLLIGANGYLGPHVVQALAPRHHLRITDIKPPPAAFKEQHRDHEFFELDVTSADQMMRAADGDTVNLDGSGSSDLDGDPLSYSWTLTTVPTGSSATLSDPTAVNPSFVADVAGTYVAQLIVNDGLLDSAPDAVNISTREEADLRIEKHDAAGIGWSIDGSAGNNRIDLLTAVSHELGHILGYQDVRSDHQSVSVMNTPLGLGTRRLPLTNDLGLPKLSPSFSDLASSPFRLGEFEPSVAIGLDAFLAGRLALRWPLMTESGSGDLLADDGNDEELWQFETEDALLPFRPHNPGWLDGITSNLELWTDESLRRRIEQSFAELGEEEELLLLHDVLDEVVESA